jgi:hypothetical protein
MPKVRRSPRSPRRPVAARRPASWPVALLGLLAVAVVGRTPTTEAPIHWTVRDVSVWMADFDGLRRDRTALLAAPSPVDAAAAPAASRMIVAEADLTPRDVKKQIPLDVVEPEYTGAVPPSVKNRPKSAPMPEVLPAINRGGKGDRLIQPQPYGRSTDRDLFVKPSLAAVPPSLDGWTPMVTLASLTAPQSDRVLPRKPFQAPVAEAGNADRVIVAMVRTGPGRVVTQSAIAALGSDHRGKARPVLPPVPESQTASLNPRTTVWAQPPVPEVGYARRTAAEVLARFRAVLGDEDDRPAAPAN